MSHAVGAAQLVFLAEGCPVLARDLPPPLPQPVCHHLGCYVDGVLLFTQIVLGDRAYVLLSA